MKKTQLLWRGYLVAVHLVLLAMAVWIGHHQAVEHSAVQASATPYYQARRSFFSEVHPPPHAIVFAGDSLTEHGHWPELLRDLNVANFGIAGDTTEGLLQRTQDFTRLQPAAIYLMIGINDITGTQRDEQTLARYRAVVERIRAEAPGASLVIQSVLPTRHVTGARIRAFNVALQEQARQAGAKFLDLYPLFLDAKGKLDHRYTFDGLHLSGAGYGVWAHAVTESISARPQPACR